MSTKWNFFDIVGVVDGYDYRTPPDCTFGFNSQGIALLNQGSATLRYSFDGYYDHGELNPLDASRGIVFDNRAECAVWFRHTTDGYGGIIRVEAWGCR